MGNWPIKTDYDLTAKDVVMVKVFNKTANFALCISPLTFFHHLCVSASITDIFHFILILHYKLFTKWSKIAYVLLWKSHFCFSCITFPLAFCLNPTFCIFTSYVLCILHSVWSNTVYFALESGRINSSFRRNEIIV